MSGLQKEIRRCDTAKVFAWANILRHHQSEQSILRHIERLIFEESRSYPLWIKLRKGELSLDQALEWAATSAKKHELKYLNQPSHFDIWHKALQKSFSRPTPLPLEFGQLIRAAQDPIDIYTIFFDLRRDPKLQSHYWEHLGAIAEKSKNERLAVFLKHAPSTSYERMVAGELLIDFYDAEAKERHISDKPDKIFIPITQTYCHDLHTARGKSIWLNNFSRAWQSKNFQFDELDMRYSGSIFGVLWRERCYAEKKRIQKADGSDWNWNDIEISSLSYENAWQLESYYYQQITDKIRSRYPNLNLQKF